VTATTERFRDLLAIYDSLEPGCTDTWNPLQNDWELAYRLSLFFCATTALRLIDRPVSTLKVLDFGCGNGRSSRMYVDLGLRPEQIIGLDLRKGAVDRAKASNPAIEFVTYDGNEIPFPDGTFDWISCSTVFSSIATRETRREVAGQIQRKLKSGAFAFYFDMVRANTFAGSDKISPLELFSALDPSYHYKFSSRQFLPGIARHVLRAARHGFIGRANPTHEALLARRK
jgi:SAM-dependent methyltransferase